MNLGILTQGSVKVALQILLGPTPRLRGKCYTSAAGGSRVLSVPRVLSGPLVNIRACVAQSVSH